MPGAQRRKYERETAVYSDAVGVLPRDNRNHWRKFEQIVAQTAADPGDEILEVGCGHGLHAAAYARRYHYTGIDISESLVEETRRRVDAVSDQWGVMQMDARDLAWDSDRFDAVVGTAILHHLDDQVNALREWLRVTKPGGSVTLAEPNYLFPKDFVAAHTAPEERHKTKLAPWRVRRTLQQATRGREATFDLTPFTYTPPWPAALTPVYDRLDAALARVPCLRWTSQMLLLHIDVGVP